MMSARTKVTIAAFGILSILLLGVAASLLPGLHLSGGGSASSTSVSPQTCVGSAATYGNMTLRESPCVDYGFPSPIIKNATLASRQVQAFIKTAYDYHLVYLAPSPSDSSVTYAVLNVTQTQVVTGNWASGYKVSYVGDRLLNVTVLQVVPSTFEVTHVSAYALPVRNESLSYTPQQAQAIQVALSDANIKSLMVAPPYYVELAASLGNGTAGGSYVVQLYQVDGTGVVGAFVSPSLNNVTGSFTEQRISGECWPNGIVITDPWDAASSGACTAQGTTSTSLSTHDSP